MTSGTCSRAAQGGCSAIAYWHNRATSNDAFGDEYAVPNGRKNLTMNQPDIDAIRKWAAGQVTHVFITHARTDVPELCDEVERLQKRVAELEAEKAERDKSLPEGAIWGIIGPPAPAKPFVLEED